MRKHKVPKKRVCAALTEKDHARLTQLALESGRTLPGYLRWLLHRHFRELDRSDSD